MGGARNARREICRNKNNKIYITKLEAENFSNPKQKKLAMWSIHPCFVHIWVGPPFVIIHMYILVPNIRKSYKKTLLNELWYVLYILLLRERGILFFTYVVKGSYLGLLTTRRGELN